MKTELDLINLAIYGFRFENVVIYPSIETLSILFDYSQSKIKELFDRNNIREEREIRNVDNKKNGMICIEKTFTEKEIDECKKSLTFNSYKTDENEIINYKAKALKQSKHFIDCTIEIAKKVKEDIFMEGKQIDDERNLKLMHSAVDLNSKALKIMNEVVSEKETITLMEDKALETMFEIFSDIPEISDALENNKLKLFEKVKERNLLIKKTHDK
jgi:hypothetical protein